jgi:Tol biopolymer transport system component
LLLDQPRATEPATTSRVGWSTSQLGAFVLLAAGASLAVAFSLAAGDRAGTDRNGPVVRFAVMPPDGTTFGTQVGQFSISPDGTHLAMVAQGTRGTTIWVRPLQSLNARELPDTVGVLGNPFWSPDSTAIAFFADGKLKRTDVNGAVTQVVCDLPGRIGLFANTQGSWGPEGIIVFPGGTNQPIFQVAAGGGTPSPVTRLADAAETHSRPAILPDGRHFTYVASVGRDRGGVWLGAIGSDESRLLLPDVTSEAVYAQGHLLFVRGDVLMVQPFNRDRREFTGEARPLGEPARFGRNPNLSVSDTGALVYSSSLTPDRQFLWVDRDGRELSKVGEPEPWGNFDLSPDETKIVTSIGRDALSGDIWILDLARGGRSRLTTDRGRDGSPVWSPKGDQIAFTRENRWQAVLISATGGTETVLLERPQGGVILDDWSPDGHHLTFNSDPALMALPLAEPSKPFAFVQTASANLDESHFSPDSKWIAYNSNETGTWQTYLAPFPPNGQRQPISTEGGVEVRWRGDGKELFFLDLSGRMLAVDVIRLSNPPQLGPPRVLFDTGIIINPRLDHYAVSSDGQRFLLRRQVALGGRFPLVVVQSWPTLLKATKPGG